MLSQTASPAVYPAARRAGSPPPLPEQRRERRAISDLPRDRGDHDRLAGAADRRARLDEAARGSFAISTRPLGEVRLVIPGQQEQRRRPGGVRPEIDPYQRRPAATRAATALPAPQGSAGRRHRARDGRRHGRTGGCAQLRRGRGGVGQLTSPRPGTPSRAGPSMAPMPGMPRRWPSRSAPTIPSSPLASSAATATVASARPTRPAARGSAGDLGDRRARDGVHGSGRGG
jgi:hypothetical protein